MRHSEIASLIKSKSAADRETCILLLQKHLQENQSDVESWYDLACCFDYLGREKEAEPNYRKVFEFGPDNLPTKDQSGFYVGFGSTLRNNNKFDESEKVLREGIVRFPNYLALKVFLGFTLYSIGKHGESSRVLLAMAGQLPTDVMDGYERAAQWYAENLD